MIGHCQPYPFRKMSIGAHPPAIAFEWGSRLREIDPASFYDTDARSLCVPASLEFFTGSRFPNCMLHLTFEPGSRLRRIDRPIISDRAPSLVCLPASLEYIDPSAFFTSTIASICGGGPTYQVAPGNTHFAMVGAALMNFARTSVIRHFDPDAAGTIDLSVEELGPSAFACHAFRSFLFPEPSRLRVIGREAFNSCLYVSAITIPSAVQVIGEYAFSCCFSLQEVRIASRSQLRLIENRAFFRCMQLGAVDVPSSATISDLFERVADVFDQDGSKRIRVRFVTPKGAY
jgi:hypothetical protein